MLEGWRDPAPGDCWSIEPRCRTILSVPPGSGLRFFLYLYFAQVEPFPATTLKVSVNSILIGSAAIGRSGDHHFEWPVPPDAISGSRAVVNMEFHPADEQVGASVRCLGIYTPRESGQALEADQQQLEELCAWSRQLEAQLEQAHRLLEAPRSEFEEELESKVAWAHSLEAELQKARRVLAKLQSEFEERTAWALKLNAELETVRADLHLISGSFWYRLGKKLRLSPAPRSERGRTG